MSDVLLRRYMIYRLDTDSIDQITGLDWPSKVEVEMWDENEHTGERRFIEAREYVPAEAAP